jgi:hypothetical protein
MSDTNLWLGDYTTITLDVTIAGGNLKVCDPLAEYLSYIPGTFVLTGGSGNPKFNGDGFSITLGPGTYTIMFEVIYDSASYKSYKDKNYAYLKDGEEIIDQDDVELWVSAYCGFHKNFDFLRDPITKEIIGDDGDGIIEVGEDIHWNFWITIENKNLGYTMYDVVIKDRFGAELHLDDGPYASEGNAYITYKKGKSKQMMLTWEVGDLIDGQKERVDMVISPGLNPSGKQSYTSPDCYLFNSGAVLKFRNPEGIQLSAHTPQLKLTVYEQDGLP